MTIKTEKKHQSYKMKSETNYDIDSLAMLRTSKVMVRKELDDSEEKLGNIWNALFHQPAALKSSSPTQKALALVTNYAGIIDGAILGWKLYRKFGKMTKTLQKKNTGKQNK